MKNDRLLVYVLPGRVRMFASAYDAVHWRRRMCRNSGVSADWGAGCAVGMWELRVEVGREGIDNLGEGQES